jgi:hypothetical protein
MNKNRIPVSINPVNPYDSTKRTMFFLSGLNVPITDYSPIYNEYTKDMNVILIIINNEFVNRANFASSIKTVVNYINKLLLKDVPFTLNSKPTPGGREFSETSVHRHRDNNPVSTVYFMAHSYGCVILMYLSALLPDIQKYTILLDPTNIKDVKLIKTSREFDENNEFINEQLTKGVMLRLDIKNQINLLITQLRISDFITVVRGVNRIQESNFYNIDNFAKVLLNFNTLQRLHDYQSYYDNNNTHFVVLPLEGDNKKFKKKPAHFIHEHASDAIIDYTNKFIDYVSTLPKQALPNTIPFSQNSKPDNSASGNGTSSKVRIPRVALSKRNVHPNTQSNHSSKSNKSKKKINNNLAATAHVNINNSNSLLSGLFSRQLSL